MILKEGELIDEKLIEIHIGISKDFNIFELIKALGKKDDQNKLKIATKDCYSADQYMTKLAETSTNIDAKAE